MDDLAYGTRDKRGNWAPNEPAKVAPIWSFPLRMGAVLKWLPHYFLPYNVIWMVLTLVTWAWVLPDTGTMQSLSWGWGLRLFLFNVAVVFLIYGALELRLYVLRAQGTHFKYNGKFPAEQPSDVFWRKSQNFDNALRTFLIGIPIWSLFQMLMLWGYANGVGNWLGLPDNWVWLVVVVLIVPVIHETHFFLIHRLIHTPWLYKHVHSVHHNSVNPSPWSSLSMHPVEHILYFSSVFYHFLLPSHPAIALYQINFAGMGAFVGHIGFDKIEVGKDRAVDSHAYIHYLHHKYFEVNYGDGLVPFDRLFGTFHDGTKEADERMKERFRAKKARIAAKRGANQ